MGTRRRPDEQASLRPRNGEERIAAHDPSLRLHDRVVEPPQLIHAAMKKILVVDDARDVADSTASLLNLLGYETRTAYDGADAVALATKYSPDVVLMDLTMPILDGFDAARKIRGGAATSHLVLIALSAIAHLSAESRLRDCGFDHWMTKPADVDALIAIIEGA